MRGLVDHATVGVQIDSSILDSFERVGIDLQDIADRLIPYVTGDLTGTTWSINPGTVYGSDTQREAYVFTSLLAERAFDIVYKDNLPVLDRTKPIVVLANGSALQLHFDETGGTVYSVVPVDIESDLDLGHDVIIEPDATYRNELLYRYQYLA